MSTAESEPFLMVESLDPEADGSYALMVELTELGEALQKAQESGVGEGRLVIMAFDHIRPRLRMSDGSDPTVAIKRVSIRQVGELIRRLSGQAAEAQDDAVNPPNGVPSAGTPLALVAKSNGHRHGSKVVRSAKSGTSRPG